MIEFTLHNKSIVQSIPQEREYLVLAKKVTNEVLTRYFLKSVASGYINPDEYSSYQLRKDIGTYIEVSEIMYDKYHDIINGISRTPFKSLERMQ
jgi:hypothetical protein